MSAISFQDSNNTRAAGTEQEVNHLQPLPVQDVGRYTNITTADTTVVASGKGVLQKIVVNKLTASSVITIYDNTAASGTKIATVTSPATLLTSQVVLPYGVRFTTGLTIVTAQADDITVVWQQ